MSNYSLYASEESDFSSTVLGATPYLIVGIKFILSTAFAVIWFGRFLIFIFLPRVKSLLILFYSSLIFCSATNALPPLTVVENISTLYFLFKSNILFCLNSRSV